MGVVVVVVESSSSISFRVNSSGGDHCGGDHCGGDHGGGDNCGGDNCGSDNRSGCDDSNICYDSNKCDDRNKCDNCSRGDNCGSDNGSGDSGGAPITTAVILRGATLDYKYRTHIRTDSTVPVATMQSHFATNLSLRYLLKQPLLRDAIYKYLTPLEQRMVDLSLGDHLMSPAQFFVDPDRHLCRFSWPFFRNCAYLTVDGIIATICANRGNVEIFGFMASSAMELEEHRIGLKHTECALQKTALQVGGAALSTDATRFERFKCQTEHVRVTVYHHGYDSRYGNIHDEAVFNHQLTRYLQTRLPNCAVSIVAIETNAFNIGKACVRVLDRRTNVETRVVYRLICDAVYFLPTSPILFHRSNDDWLCFRANNDMFRLARTLTWRFYDPFGRPCSDWKRLALLQTDITATELMCRQKEPALRHGRPATHPVQRTAQSFVATCWSYFETLLTERNRGNPLYDYVALLPSNIDIVRHRPKIYFNMETLTASLAAPRLSALSTDAPSAALSTATTMRATTTPATLPTALATASTSTTTTAMATTPDLVNTRPTITNASTYAPTQSTSAVLCHAYCLRNYDFAVFENLALIAAPEATFPNKPLIIPVTENNKLITPFYPSCDLLARKIRQMLTHESFNMSAAW